MVSKAESEAKAFNYRILYGRYAANILYLLL